MEAAGHSETSVGLPIHKTAWSQIPENLIILNTHLADRTDVWMKMVLLIVHCLVLSESYELVSVDL
jgi:hypothetical protein